MSDNLVNVLQDRLRLKNENEKLKEEKGALERKVAELERKLDFLKQHIPDLQVRIEEVWENQRRTTPWTSWSEKDLILTDRKGWTDISGKERPKDAVPLELSFEWINEWHIDMQREGIDNEGWDYAFNWEFRWSDTASPTSFVRKRRWARTMRHKLTQEYELLDQGKDETTTNTLKNSNAKEEKVRDNHQFLCSQGSLRFRITNVLVTIIVSLMHIHVFIFVINIFSFLLVKVVVGIVIIVPVHVIVRDAFISLNFCIFWFRRAIVLMVFLFLMLGDS